MAADMNRKCVVILAMFQFVAIGSASAQPTIFWFNDPVGPDETVLVSGADLNEVTSATVARIPDQGSTPEAEKEASVELLQVNPLSLKFVIPKEFAPGTYRFNLIHAQGSLAGRINLPTIYWTQGDLGDSVSPGGWIQ